MGWYGCIAIGLVVVMLRMVRLVVGFGVVVGVRMVIWHGVMVWVWVVGFMLVFSMVVWWRGRW